MKKVGREIGRDGGNNCGGGGGVRKGRKKGGRRRKGEKRKIKGERDEGRMELLLVAVQL